MSLFSKMKTDNLEKTVDRVGGGYQASPSNIYDAKIKMLYITESRNGAKAWNIVADVDGKEYKETAYFTNTSGDFFYTDKQDAKKKHPMPSFTTLNDLCLLATGEPLSEQDEYVEEKMVKIYNHKERAEVPTKVPVVTSLTGTEVKLAILRIKEFKQEKDEGGNYVDTADTRTINVIDKVLHSDTGRIVNEYLQEIEPAEFMPAWLKANEGKDRDRTAGKGGATGAGNTGSGRPASSDEAKPKSKLFGKK